jgi:hypothetical protein
MDMFDVRIHAMRRQRNRGRPFEVRWHVGTRDMASDLHRYDLIHPECRS